LTSLIVSVTSVTSFIGLIINVSVLLMVLFRGKQRYHLLFAPLLMITACWDIGIFLVMIRNSHPSEVLQYQNIVTVPITFFPLFIFLFTTAYLSRPRRILTLLLCVYSVTVFFGLIVTGGGSSGVYQYSWGTVAKYDTSNPLMASWSVVYPLTLIYSCWLLFRARKSETDSVTRRHITYILASFIVFGVATIKILVTMGFDLPFTVPFGMLLVDTFGALIGIAILKHQLFDIGAAGPLTGFILALPALFIGLAFSKVVLHAGGEGSLVLGEPLVFKLADLMFFRNVPPDAAIALHPAAFAGPSRDNVPLGIRDPHPGLRR
jgi:hypothetical protein